MNKWFGKIGFNQTEEIRPGVWKDTVIERNFYGDILTNSRRWETSESVNDDLKINVRISILANSFVMDNMYKIKYLEYGGTLWKVSSIDIQAPRLILSLGGIWNGETPETT